MITVLTFLESGPNLSGPKNKISKNIFLNKKIELIFGYFYVVNMPILAKKNNYRCELMDRIQQGGQTSARLQKVYATTFFNAILLF